MCKTVASSWIFICNPPSPVKQIILLVCESFVAKYAPIAKR